MKNKVLYLSYNGMMEPLGASQVLSYVYELSDKYGYIYHLVSLEKEVDFEDKVNFEVLNQNINSKGISWHPIKYSSSKLGKLFNFIRFAYAAYKIIKKEKIEFVHCRSYVTASAIYFIKKLTSVEYLFDTRSFSFDERADVGSLDRHGRLYKLSKRFEIKLYQQAAGTVILAKTGKEAILNDELFQGGSQIKNIEIIPTCVDLKRFKFHTRDYNKTKINIGYVGTAVGWYDFEKTVATLKKIGESVDYHFVVFNSNQYGQHDFIREMLSKHDIPAKKYTIERIAFEEMPQRLKEIDIALFYIHPYFSKKASAATKLGELLASGIPVMTNGGVGDHEYYLETYNVGEVLRYEELESYNFEEITTNLHNFDTARRCRKLAEKYFSLDEGAKKYDAIYQRIS